MIPNKKGRVIKIPKTNRVIKIKEGNINMSNNQEVNQFQSTKTHSGVLDWRFDWTDWLPRGDVITKNDIVISQPEHPKKVTNKQTTLVNGVVIVWLGSGRKGTKYRITNKIKTRDGREEESYFDLTII